MNLQRNVIQIGLLCATMMLAPQTTHAQGTTYLSNLGQSSAGSVTVGNDSWLAELFQTGTNVSGYTLNSIQLRMTDATGNPNGFTVMLYSSFIGAVFPRTNLDTLDGSLSPVTGGIFTYTPTSNLTLSPYTYYFIVLTAGTAIADGAYEWSYASAISYNPSGSWKCFGNVSISSNGSSWNSTFDSAQFAINATAVPESGVLGLSGLGGLCFLWHRRKSKTV